MLQKYREGEDEPYETIYIDATGRATVVSRDDEPTEESV